jgi:hypothetical protein
MTLDNRERTAASCPVAGTPPSRVRRVSLVLSHRAQRNAVGATYDLLNGRGQRVALVSVAQQGLGSTRAAAARMAYAPELTGAIRAASMDYELTGAVTPETISLMRRLLDDIAVA